MSLPFADNTEVTQLIAAVLGFAVKAMVTIRNFENLNWAVVHRRSPEVIFVGKRAIRRSVTILIIEIGLILAGVYGVLHGPPFPGAEAHVSGLTIVIDPEYLSEQGRVNRLVMAVTSILLTFLVLMDYVDSRILQGWHGPERRTTSRNESSSILQSLIVRARRRWQGR
jgi:hypothetical protein